MSHCFEWISFQKQRVLYFFVFLFFGVQPIDANRFSKPYQIFFGKTMTNLFKKKFPTSGKLVETEAKRYGQLEWKENNIFRFVSFGCFVDRLRRKRKRKKKLTSLICRSSVYNDLIIDVDWPNFNFHKPFFFCFYISMCVTFTPRSLL